MYYDSINHTQGRERERLKCLLRLYLKEKESEGNADNIKI